MIADEEPLEVPGVEVETGVAVAFGLAGTGIAVEVGVATGPGSVVGGAVVGSGVLPGLIMVACGSIVAVAVSERGVALATSAGVTAGDTVSFWQALTTKTAATITADRIAIRPESNAMNGNFN